MAAKDSLDLSVVLPVFNEEGSIGELVSRVTAVLEASKLKFEVLVVDDGSSDGSAAEVAALNSKQVSLLRHPYNKGNGSAIKTGMRAARGRTIACMDSDGQHDPTDLLRLYEHSENFDLVVGARTEDYKGHPVRNFGNSFFNWLASGLTQFNVQDLTSGFRLFKTEAIKDYIDLLPARFSYPTTSTLIFLKVGYNIKYVPIRVMPRSKGSSKIRVVRDGWRFLMIMLKIIVLFEPLQVFLPVSAVFLVLAVASTAYSSLTLQRLFIPNSGSLFFSSAVLVFLLGLIAEQITNLQIIASKHER